MGRKAKPIPPSPDAAPRRAALYVRVSTRDKGQTIENQLPVLREFATLNGWEVVAVFSDHDHGDKPEREGFQAMLAAAERKEFDVVVFWSLDRFSREGSFPTMAYLQQLNSWGVKFRSYTEQYLDTCGIFKDAIIALLAALARQEQLRLRERVKAGITRYRNQNPAKSWGAPSVVVDMDRFRRMEQLYSVRELCNIFQAGKTTIYRLRAKVRAQSMAEMANQT